MIHARLLIHGKFGQHSGVEVVVALTDDDMSSYIAKQYPNHTARTDRKRFYECYGDNTWLRVSLIPLIESKHARLKAIEDYHAGVENPIIERIMDEASIAAAESGADREAYFNLEDYIEQYIKVWIDRETNDHS